MALFPEFAVLCGVPCADRLREAIRMRAEQRLSAGVAGRMGVAP